MEYSQFVDDIQQCIRWKVDNEYDIKVNRITKNNSVELDGIVFFKEGDNISPNIYLNQYYNRYQDGESVENIADDIIDLYQRSMQNQAKEYEEFELAFENMKEKIIYRLVNYEKNKALLENVPHIRFLDLAITFHCLVKQDDSGIGTVRITNEHLGQWDVKVKELLQLASRNTKRLFPIKFSTMEQVIAEILRKDMHIFEDMTADSEEQKELLDSVIADMMQNESKPAMYILTNTIGINGATALIYKDAIREFAMKMETDFYILPSSIHEVILVPYEENIEVEYLKNMVEEVNGSQVPEEDILSDKVYLYRRETNVIDF